MKFTDNDANQLMAAILHQLHIPVPGPGAGLQVTMAIDGVKKALVTHGDRLAADALRMYLDAMEFVAGVWAHQQRYVIEDLEKYISASTAASLRPNDNGPLKTDRPQDIQEK